MKMCRRLAFLFFAILLAGCQSETGRHALVGEWRAVLESPGGELPFALVIQEQENGELYAYAVNGEERAPFSSVMLEGSRVELAFAWYDGEITAEVDGSAETMTGRWRKTASAGDSMLPFHARRGGGDRFTALSETRLGPGDPDAITDITGEWSVQFTDEDGTQPAQGEFRQSGDEVTGTFLTPTGDYRFLEGSFENGVLRLSTFDGAHAFLFVARADSEGVLSGDFWSRDSYHATWIAHRLVEGEEVLPDGWALVGVNNEESRFTFAFDDSDGERVTNDDARFDGKVVVVNLFGTWCPNCNDEAPLLSRWYREYKDDGLEVVGIAFEYTGDVERDRRQIARYAERHGIDYTLLLGGTSDKSDAAAALPDVDTVIAFPTTIFVGRDGTVRRIYSGYSGPGTGEHHDQLLVEFETLLAELLNEAARA